MHFEIKRFINGEEVEEDAFFSHTYRNERVSALIRRAMRRDKNTSASGANCETNDTRLQG